MLLLHPHAPGTARPPIPVLDDSNTQQSCQRLLVANCQPPNQARYHTCICQSVSLTDAAGCTRPGGVSGYSSLRLLILGACIPASCIRFSLTVAHRSHTTLTVNRIQNASPVLVSPSSQCRLVGLVPTHKPTPRADLPKHTRRTPAGRNEGPN
jgi:hypothetical protein